MGIVIDLNNFFFETHGYVSISEFQQVFKDFIMSYVTEEILILYFVYIIGLFFAGMYVGKILLRPFEHIGNYANEIILDDKAAYNPDFYSDFRILTRFSELFFTHFGDSIRSNKISKMNIPNQYTKIHSPAFDRIFFFHFSLIIILISTITYAGLHVITIEIHDAIVNLAVKTLNSKKQSEALYFITHQKEILERIQFMGVVLVAITYSALTIHLYQKVSGAAFGFFSTMRSFAKGNYSARVHLIGYVHIRQHGRSLNKYLDLIQRKLAPQSMTKDSDSE
jgi:hypothetical protein